MCALMSNLLRSVGPESGEAYLTVASYGEGKPAASEESVKESPVNG